jgi:O-antigen ligase
MVTKSIQQRSIKLKVTFALLALIVGGLLGFAIGQFGKPLYIVLGVIGGVLFIVSIFSIETGLFVLVFLTYTRFSDIAVHYHNAPSIAKLYIFVLGVLILIRWIVFKEHPVGWQRAAVIIGIYGLVLASSLLYASDTTLVSQKLNDIAKDVFITFIVIVLLKNSARLRAVVWSLIIAGFFLGTISVFQYLTSTFENNYWGFAQTALQQYVGVIQGYRISGPIGDANYYAQIMIVIVPIALERVLHERKRILRFIAIWALLVSLLSVVFTYSRGGFLALSAALLVWFFIYPPGIKYLPLLIIVGVVILMLIPQEYMDRIFSLRQLISGSSVGFKTEDTAFRGRVSETLAAVEMIKKHPFLGVGFNNYMVNYQKYAKSIGLAPNASERAAHDLYLEVVAETGLIGLTTFLLLIGVVARDIINTWKKLRTAKRDELAAMVAAIGVSFLGYLFAAIFIHSAFPRYFWLLIGICMALPQVVKNTLQSEQ